VVESGRGVSIADLTETEVVEHLEVLLNLQLLELLQGLVSLVNSQEVNELDVVFDLLVQLIDSFLVFVNVLLDC